MIQKPYENIQKSIKIINFKSIENISLGWLFVTDDHIQAAFHLFGQCLRTIIDKINQQAENDKSYSIDNKNNQLHKSYNNSISIYGIIDHSLAVTLITYNSKWPVYLNLSNFSQIELLFGTGTMLNVVISRNCKHLEIGGNYCINVSKSCLQEVEYLKLGHESGEHYHIFKPLNIIGNHQIEIDRSVTKLANQCSGVKRFHILSWCCELNRFQYLWWKSIKHYLRRNNAYVKLEVSAINTNKLINVLKLVEKNQFMVTHLEIAHTMMNHLMKALLNLYNLRCNLQVLILAVDHTVLIKMYYQHV